jgi:hypothetical protein
MTDMSAYVFSEEQKKRIYNINIIELEAVP